MAAKKKAKKKATKKRSTTSGSTRSSTNKKATAKRTTTRRSTKKKAAKRTTQRSGSGSKLYAKRAASGEFEDIQTYKRAHGSDVKRVSKAESAARKKSGRPARKTAKKK